MTRTLFTRADASRRVTWRTLAGIILVPLVIAGLFIWGLWSPTERMNDVHAAVVNLDEPVTIDGQLTPLGRVVAGQLIGNDDANNFTWTLTDEEDASAGLDDGRYATVVTIPENFSAAATSTAGEPADATQATIDIATSDRGKLIDQALSQVVTSTTASVLNQQLATTFVENVFVGFNTLGTQLGTAADGAKQLADGGGKLADGATDLATGTRTLADGTAQLADGASALGAGTAQLADGAAQTSAGASGLAAGTEGIRGGIADLADGGTDLAGGAGLTADGAAELAAGLRAYVAGVDQLAGGLEQVTGPAVPALRDLRGLIAQAISELEKLPELPNLTPQAAPAVDGAQAAASQQALAQNAGDISGLAAECQAAAGPDAAAFCERLTAASQGLTEQSAQAGELLAQAATPPTLEQLQLPELPSTAEVIGYLRKADQQISGLIPQIETLNGQLGQLPAGGAALVAGADGLAQGTRGIAGGIDELAVGAHDLAGGAGQVSAGAAQLSDGTGALAAGASDLNVGVGQLTSNIPMLVDGTTQLAEGSAALAEGAGQAERGQRELATGLDTAVQSLPTTTDDERVNLAEVAVTPVLAKGSGDELFNASGVPLFAAIALWAGALASFLLLAPVWHRARDAARGVGWITARSTLPALVTGAAQGLVVGIAMPIALSLDASAFLSFAGLSVCAGIVFALVNQGLVALLRGWGRFLSLVMLVLAFASGIVSTAPGLLSGLAAATPLAPAIDGFQAIAAGVGGAGAAFGALLLWAVIGAGLLGFAVRRERVQTRVLAVA